MKDLLKKLDWKSVGVGGVITALLAGGTVGVKKIIDTVKERKMAQSIESFEELPSDDISSED